MLEQRQECGMGLDLAMKYHQRREENLPLM